MAKSKKKKLKLKSYVVNIQFSSYQRRWFHAKSAKQAKKMFENGDEDYDMDECCTNETVISIKEVK